MTIRRIVAPAVIVTVSAIVVSPAAPVAAQHQAAATARPCPTVEAPSRPAGMPSPPPVDPTNGAVGGTALGTAGLVVPADTPKAPAVTATSWVVADLASGRVLGGCGPHQHRTPASVQKLLLAAALLPRLDPTKVVEVTREDLDDLDPASSLMGVVAGGRYTVKELWLGLLLQSGNDAANVLARIGGGSAGREGGVQVMNEEARRLRANQTHAVTPSGLDGTGQYTSAYDLALIARATFARDDFRRYIATRTAHLPSGPGRSALALTGDETLLGTYPGMLGGKTGFTDLARQTYVGVAERDGRRLAVTLLGAETAPLGSLGEAAALLNWGFALAPDDAVGHLVAPEQAKKDKDKRVVVAGDDEAGAGAGSGSLVPVAVGTVAALLTVLVGVLAGWRRAGRRVAG
ncbi:D-alanyl-D-alanine carboxypeptidase family protein [Salinispora arenicola]|uniref:Serine-type D-Ala-D-Ala carboxypeptidase n=1 Tax=Salinispora arenicola (strain CNS-205) TaxID=391037 RepID=A8M4R1_SALAI|nr:serine hydrolase [Salinispora arenicola]MCN0179130.1 serine hydrolase [Salinispora arenicola]NIL59377.1 D-alanyl-D-alanine carboxypeptidase [Salinispora arenicola]NIL60913.1 D-alanyl-D-alanine carboxypeptidase [Salinispora arenicola]